MFRALKGTRGQTGVMAATGIVSTRAGTVVPEQAIDDNSIDRLGDYLTDVLRDELRRRLDAVHELDSQRKRSLADERRYVEAMLDFQVHSHRLYEAMRATTTTRRPHTPHAE